MWSDKHIKKKDKKNTESLKKKKTRKIENNKTKGEDQPPET